MSLNGGLFPSTSILENMLQKRNEKMRTQARGGCGERKRAILGAEMRKSIIVSAEYGQCIYSGPLRIAEVTYFCLQICGNRGKKLRNAELHTPSDSPPLNHHQGSDLSSYFIPAFRGFVAWIVTKHPITAPDSPYCAVHATFLPATPC